MGDPGKTHVGTFEGCVSLTFTSATTKETLVMPVEEAERIAREMLVRAQEVRHANRVNAASN